MQSGQPNLVEVLQKRVIALKGQGKLDDALRVAQTATETARKQVEKEPGEMPKLVTMLLMVADLKRMCGDLEGAETVYSEGLNLAADLSEKPEGPIVSQLEIARLQSGLASLYDFTGREDAAVPMYEEAIQRFEANDPPEFEEAAYLCNNIAMIYKQAGYFEAAEGYYLKALDVFEHARGEDHPSVGTVLNNLGSLYTSMEQPEKARAMHLRAMEIRERVYPKNHPDLGQSLHNLATTYHQLNDFNNARKYYELALRLFEKNPDDEEEGYDILLANYAELLRAHHQEKKAETLEKRLEARRQKAAGETQGAA